MTEPVIYRRRRSAISRSEREWRVEGDALVTCGGSGRERRYRWSDIVSVRLLHDPAKSRPWRYVFELQPKHARKITIDNAHYIGDRTFEVKFANEPSCPHNAKPLLAAVFLFYVTVFSVKFVKFSHFIFKCFHCHGLKN